MQSDSSNERFVRPEDIEDKFNSKNINLRERYLEYLNGRLVSQSTIRLTRSSLNKLFVYLYYRCGNKRMVDMTPSDYLGYFSWIARGGVRSSAAFMNARDVCSGVIRFLKRFYKEQYGHLVNYPLRISPPPYQARNHWTSPMLSKEQCTEMLDHMCEIGQFQRACFFALAMSTGMPLAALIYYRLDYIDEDFLVNGLAYRTPEPIYIGDNKYQTVFVLEEPFMKYFRAWLGVRQKRKIRSQWLFPSLNNEREHITQKTSAIWLKDLRNLSGYGMLSADSFCRYYCSRLIEIGFTKDTVKPLFTGGNRKRLMELFLDTESADKSEEAINSLDPGDIDLGEFSEEGDDV